MGHQRILEADVRFWVGFTDHGWYRFLAVRCELDGRAGRGRVDRPFATMYTYIVERTQIYLTRAEATALDREAKRTGRTRSHLIREAIDDRYLAGHQPDELRAGLRAAFGAWKGRTMSGAEFVESLRTGTRLDELTAQAQPPTRHRAQR